MSILTTVKETLNKAEGILLYLIAQVFFFFGGHINNDMEISRLGFKSKKKNLNFYAG